MKNIILAVLVWVMVFVFSGCSYSEPDAKFTVTAVGFSENRRQITAYLQAINGINSGNGSVETFETTGQGNTVLSAIKDIKTKLSKEPSFEHCEIIFLSDGIEGGLLKQTLLLCEELGMSSKTRLVYTRNISNVLQNEKLKSGSDIVALIMQNSKTLGYGKHGALFEINTAMLVNSGNFALVNIETQRNEIKFSGLVKYQNGKIGELLSPEESVRYAKEIE